MMSLINLEMSPHIVSVIVVILSVIVVIVINLHIVSVAGFEMILRRHISHYLITYYLPSGETLFIIAISNIHQSFHYRARAIKEGQFRFANLTSHFIRIQIFQIDFPLILYLQGTKCIVFKMHFIIMKVFFMFFFAPSPY